MKLSSAASLQLKFEIAYSFFQVLQLVNVAVTVLLLMLLAL